MFVSKKQDQTLLWTCVAGAHIQYVNNNYAKFEYKGMKTVGVRLYTANTMQVLQRHRNLSQTFFMKR